MNHEVAVRAMRENPTSVELTVFRNNDANTSICSGTRLAVSFSYLFNLNFYMVNLYVLFVTSNIYVYSFQSPEHTLDMSFMSDAANMSLNRETLTVSLKRLVTFSFFSLNPFIVNIYVKLI